jgi:hypothetical protein
VTEETTMAANTTIDDNAATAAGLAGKGNLTAGLVLIGLGLIFLATTLGWISWAFIGSLWPLFLIVPGAALLLGGDRSKVIGGILLLGLGLVFLSTSTGLLPDGSWGYIWPIFLIVPGLALLVGRGR